MVTAKQLKKPVLIVTWGKPHKSTVSHNYVSATVAMWIGYKTETGEKCWFGSHDYSRELPSRYYVDLNLEGYVNSDQKPKQGLIVNDFVYRDVNVSAGLADFMNKTHKRISGETWKQAP